MTLSNIHLSQRYSGTKTFEMSKSYAWLMYDLHNIVLVDDMFDADNIVYSDNIA